MSVQDGNTQGHQPAKKQHPDNTVSFGVGILAAAGAIGVLVYAGYFFLRNERTNPQLPTDFSFLRDVVGPNFTFILIVVIALILALLAARLLTKTRLFANSGRVIRDEDRILLEPLVRNADKDAITEYIRLASLTGFSGTFTKLGFTGLPLVTVALTLILLITAATMSEGDMQKSVFDMAKLTLGAFLGSFVQRNIEQEKLAGAVKSLNPPLVEAPKKEEPPRETGEAEHGKPPGK
jgi:hypothetical protein